MKVAIITGTAAGIGAACAKRLSQDGIAVGILDLDEARCVQTVEAIMDAGGTAVALAADIPFARKSRRRSPNAAKCLDPSRSWSTTLG